MLTRNHWLRILTIQFALICFVANCPISAKSARLEKGFIDKSLAPILVGSSDVKEKNSDASQKPKLALALGGGGIRAAAHIGVLRVLQKEGIPIKSIAGCSMGAIIGGLFCAGLTLDEIESIVSDKAFKSSYATRFIPLAIIKIPIKCAMSSLNLRQKSCLGFSDGKAFRDFIDTYVPEDKKLIGNLKPSFVAVAANINDCKAYKFASGNLADCILVSSAMPPVVKPLQINDSLYCDGGFCCNVPVQAAKEFGDDIVIAVSVDKLVKYETSDKLKNTGALASHLASSVYSVLDDRDCQNADLVIAPDVSNIPIFSANLDYIKAAIKAGEEATYKSLPAIKRALN